MKDSCQRSHEYDFLVDDLGFLIMEPPKNTATKDKNWLAVGQRYRDTSGLLRGVPGTANSSEYKDRITVPGTVYTDKLGVCKVVEVATYAFYNAQYVEAVTLPGTMKRIAHYAFLFCWGMEEIKLPEGLEAIENKAFRCCLHLRNITIPDSVRELGEGAFEGCFALEKVVIGKGVRFLTQTFRGDARIKEVICRSPVPPVVDEYTFDARVYNNVLYVPYNRWLEYKEHPMWGKFKRIEPIKETIPGIDNNFWIDNIHYHETSAQSEEMYVKESVSRIPEITIPRKVDYANQNYTIVAIGKEAFKEKTNLETITLPDTIRLIKEFAFFGSSLKSIKLSNSLYGIGKGAFGNCLKLKEIDIPARVEYLGECAFDGCTGLERITLHDGLMVLGDYCLNQTHKLKPFTIPSTVQIIGPKACRQVGIECGEEWALKIPDSVNTMGDEAFRGCNLSSVTIGKGLTRIEDRAFSNTTLKEIFLPDTITSIGTEAFGGVKKNLQTVTCMALTPPVVEQIAFDPISCEHAKLIVPAAALAAYKAHPIWGSFKEIVGIGDDGRPVVPLKDDCFMFDGICYHIEDADAKQVFVTALPDALPDAGTYKGDLVIPPTVTYRDETYDVVGIGKEACMWCKELVSVDIPDSVISVGKRAFKDCRNLVRLTLHNGLLKIGEEAFENLIKLKSYTIPDTVREIGPFAFAQTAIGKYGEEPWDLIIPDSVVSLGRSAFAFYGNFRRVTIGKGVRKIETNLFFNSKMKELFIPDNVSDIDTEAFISYENNLKTIICMCAPWPPRIESNVFSDETFKNVTLKVPAHAISHYKSYAIWCNFKNIVAVDNDNRLSDEFFMADGIRYLIHDADAKEVWMTALPDGEKYKGDLAIPPSVKYKNETYAVKGIEKDACLWCENLVSVDIPGSVETVGESAFGECRNMVRLTLHNGLRVIEKSAFKNLFKLKSYTIPDTVREIGPAAFAQTAIGEDGEKPWDLIIPDSVVSLGASAFAFYTNFRRVTIGRGISKIGANILFNSKMKELFIPDTVTEIGDEAFMSYKSQENNRCKLRTITCMATTPPKMPAMKAFREETFKSATLKVPASALDAYKADAQWGKFKKIEAVS